VEIGMSFLIDTQNLFKLACRNIFQKNILTAKPSSSFHNYINRLNDIGFLNIIFQKYTINKSIIIYTLALEEMSKVSILHSSIMHIYNVFYYYPISITGNSFHVNRILSVIKLSNRINVLFLSYKFNICEHQLYFIIDGKVPIKKKNITFFLLYAKNSKTLFLINYPYSGIRYETKHLILSNCYIHKKFTIKLDTQSRFFFIKLLKFHNIGVSSQVLGLTIGHYNNVIKYYTKATFLNTNKTLLHTMKNKLLAIKLEIDQAKLVNLKSAKILNNLNKTLKISIINRLVCLKLAVKTLKSTMYILRLLDKDCSGASKILSTKVKLLKIYQLSSNVQKQVLSFNVLEEW
jgi:hypothetical protein